MHTQVTSRLGLGHNDSIAPVVQAVAGGVLLSKIAITGTIEKRGLEKVCSWWLSTP